VTVTVIGIFVPAFVVNCMERLVSAQHAPAIKAKEKQQSVHCVANGTSGPCELPSAICSNAKNYGASHAVSLSIISSNCKLSKYAIMRKNRFPPSLSSMN